MVVVVCGWFAESSYSRPDQAPDSKVLKEQSSPALFTKLLEMQAAIMQKLLYVLPSTRVPFHQGKRNRQYTSSVPKREYNIVQGDFFQNPPLACILHQLAKHQAPRQGRPLYLDRSCAPPELANGRKKCKLWGSLSSWSRSWSWLPLSWS